MVYLPRPNEIVCKNNSTIVCTGVPGVVVRGDGNMVIIDDGLIEEKTIQLVVMATRSSVMRMISTVTNALSLETKI